LPARLAVQQPFEQGTIAVTDLDAAVASVVLKLGLDLPKFLRRDDSLVLAVKNLGLVFDLPDVNGIGQ